MRLSQFNIVILIYFDSEYCNLIALIIMIFLFFLKGKQRFNNL